VFFRLIEVSSREYSIATDPWAVKMMALGLRRWNLQFSGIQGAPPIVISPSEYHI
jgi:hypothetical protein